MDMNRAAFTALYVPVIVFALLAAFVFIRNVIIPAIERKQLSIRHHGLAMAISTGLIMDAAENTYYGLGRLNSQWFPSIQHTYPAMIGIKISVMSTSVIALVTYFRIMEKPFGFRHIIIAGAFMWAIAFMALSVL